MCDGVREAVLAPQHSVLLLQVAGSSLLTDATSLLEVHTHTHHDAHIVHNHDIASGGHTSGHGVDKGRSVPSNYVYIASMIYHTCSNWTV